MTVITKKGVNLAIVSVLLFTPTLSHAQLNTSVTGDAMVQLQDMAKTNIDTKTEIDTIVDSAGTQDASIDIEVSAGAAVNTDMEIYAESNTENNAEVESSSIDLSSVGSTSLKVNAAGIAVTSSSEVGSEVDLEVFSANVAAKEKAVAEVDIASGAENAPEVKVVYRHSGKLFGFIPVAIKSTTVVKAKANAEAEIRSTLPWWSFLVANKNYIKTEIESRIRSNAVVKANAKVDASAQAKAQVVEAVIAEIAAHTSAQASLEN